MAKHGSKTKSLSTLESNPLPEMINFLPWKPTLVDINMLDGIREIIVNHVGSTSVITDKYIMCILHMLMEQKFVLLELIPNELGEFYLITRI